jgi:hypothetical protein
MSGRGNPERDLPVDTRPCSEVRFDVVLVDVKPEIATTVSIGDRLAVELLEGRYPAVTTPAGILGSIASGVLSRLVQCLREGVRFEAEVLELQGALVRARIAPT